jgi:hypothetical protein
MFFSLIPTLALNVVRPMVRTQSSLEGTECFEQYLNVIGWHYLPTLVNILVFQQP